MDTKVDWTEWARHAADIVCPACSRTFRPNHPRRRFCGAADCPGRQRRPASASRPTAKRPARRKRLRAVTSNALAALVAETTVELHRIDVKGTSDELLVACAALARAARTRQDAKTERRLTVRVLAIAAVRAAAASS